MENKKTLEWYKEKPCPRRVNWHDGSMGSDLFFRARCQALDVRGRTYRWNESGSNVCVECEGNDVESVEHVMLECPKYARERQRMMNVVLKELAAEENVLMGRDGKEWMISLLGLNEERTNESVRAVKMFLEEVWCMRRK